MHPKASICQVHVHEHLQLALLSLLACAESLPANIRHIQWNELKATQSTNAMVLVGEGTFAQCYYMKLGAMKVCMNLVTNIKPYFVLRLEY